MRHYESDERSELLESIELDREDVRVALHELTIAASSKLDLNDHIRSAPFTWAFAAFLVGAWLGDRAGSQR
jgi:hypothetical protein